MSDNEGFGALASVKVTFDPFTVPPGTSPLANFGTVTG